MQRTGKYVYSLVILASFMLFSCHSQTSRNGAESGNKTVKQTRLSIPAFSADSAYAYVKKQVGFGPRIPNTPAHAKCAAWLIARMKSFADSVTVQRTPVSTHGKSYNCINIIAHFNAKAGIRTLLLAHWDTRAFADAVPATKTRHFDGADDGGSGVGVLLEIARQLQQKKPAIG